MNPQVIGRRPPLHGDTAPPATGEPAPASASSALRPRLVLLALACALPPWALVAFGALDAARPRAAAGTVVVLALASLAVVLWLLRSLARDLDTVAAEAAAGQRAARLLQVRTRERDRALRAKAELTREVQCDTLTQLANRGAFLRRLDAALERRLDSGGQLSLFYIDLDDFKAVNDHHGHAVGDAMLSAFATRLAGEVRAGDLAARLSGDEFAVLIDGIGAAEAEPIARALVQRLSGPYGLGDQVLDLSVSVGIAAFPAQGRTAAELLQAADSAMYAAKAAGKGGFRRSGWADMGPPGTGRPEGRGDSRGPVR